MKLVYFIRSLIASIIFILFTTFWCIVSIINNLTFAYKPFDNFIVVSWGEVTCWLFNIEVVTHNIDRVSDTGAVFLFNHSSFLDIFALISQVPGLRFGAKIELFKIPIFGTAIRRAGTLPIARGSREEVFKVYSDARSRIANKEKFALSPEGGRFHGQELNPFKSGPFIFAISSGATIYPVIIKGVFEAMPKGRLIANSDRWKRQVDVYFLDPIETKNYSLEDRQELQKVVYDRMNAKWTEPDPPGKY